MKLLIDRLTSSYRWSAILAVSALLTSCAPQQAAGTPPPTPAAGVAGARAAGQSATWNFDADAAGSVPKGATVFSGKWGVRAESDAPSQPNALCRTGSAEYPAISLSDASYTDVAVSARFKPISGNTDRAAGIIFRVRDRRNYYILRANALENNVNLYRYQNGSRSLIKEGSAAVPSGQWQSLRLEVAGNRLRGYLNDQLVVEATDYSFKTGGIGLWTKADSVTCFDDVSVQPR